MKSASFLFNGHVSHTSHGSGLCWVLVQSDKQDRHRPCPQGSYKLAAKSDFKNVIITKHDESYDDGKFEGAYNKWD